MTEKVKLVANDATVVEINLDVAFKSTVVKEMYTNLQVPEEPPKIMEIDVSPVNGKVLKKIIEYCTMHKDKEYVPKTPAEDPRIELSKEDIEYMAVDDDFLLQMLTGANFLNIPGLLDIICQKIANMIKGKTPEEIREIFMLDNDLTEEEKGEIRQKYAWLDI